MAAETLTDLLDSSGFVRVQWTNAGVGANFYGFRVYRLYDEDGWLLIHQTTTNQPNYFFDDWAAPANVAVQYDVVMVTLSGGNLVEEARTPTTIIPKGSDYWLIHPTNSGMSLRLRHVTSDNFSDEVEEETMELIGRGRKIDTGTRWGVSGTLTAEFRDVEGGPSGRDQQMALRSLKRTQDYLYLRNPFGDVWKVGIGTPEFDRVSGVGTRDFSTATFSYEEVA